MSTWQRSSDTSMRQAPWTVAKVMVKGNWSYELWHDAMPLPAGRFPSFDAARSAAERMGKGEQ